MVRYVVAHGGTGSQPKLKDGTEQAVSAGWNALHIGTPLDAAVAAVAVLEDDPRFNCGTGSALKFDGRTIEMDAAVMESDRGYGGVCGIQGVKNPIMVAKDLVALPNNLLCGQAADAFARRRGHPKHDPLTKKAEKQWGEMIERVRSGKAKREECQWDLPTLERCWNYERPFEEVFGDLHVPSKARGKSTKVRSSDTVGAIVFDGNSFAAAGSTGGTITTLRGRIGDTPAIGGGIFASENGAVACSGSGDTILRMRLATGVEQRLEEGDTAREALDWALANYPEDLDVCLIVGDRKGFAVGGNRSFAWSAKSEEVDRSKPGARQARKQPAAKAAQRSKRSTGRSVTKR